VKWYKFNIHKDSLFSRQKRKFLSFNEPAWRIMLFELFFAKNKFLSFWLDFIAFKSFLNIHWFLTFQDWNLMKSFYYFEDQKRWESWLTKLIEKFCYPVDFRKRDFYWVRNFLGWKIFPKRVLKNKFFYISKKKIFQKFRPLKGFFRSVHHSSSLDEK